MNFELTFDSDEEVIYIIYDNSLSLRSYIDEEVEFINFEKIKDETIEKILKTLCRQIFSQLT